jgi:hypothetical protein
MRYIIIFLLFAIGCSEAKKLQKAENRVLANVNSLNKVGLEYLKLHPCVNDSVWAYIPGDTITQLLPFVDSIETIRNDTVYKEKIRTQIKTVHDTIKITIKDQSETKRLKDTVDTYKQRQIDLQAKALSWQEKYNYADHRGDTLLCLVIIISLVSGVIIFRKPIFSLFSKLPI